MHSVQPPMIPAKLLRQRQLSRSRWYTSRRVTGAKRPPTYDAIIMLQSFIWYCLLEPSSSLGRARIMSPLSVKAAPLEPPPCCHGPRTLETAAALRGGGDKAVTKK